MAFPAGINNGKRARHPKEFFSSEDGGKFLDSYDFVPDLVDPLWDDPAEFILKRRESFVTMFEDKYELADVLQVME